MGKIQTCLDEGLISFITGQKMFFVASAPLDQEGMVNTSPKGYSSFRVFDDHTVGYLDYPGSGNETARHVMENGRLTIMFCSFEERPLIVRLYGNGEVIEKSSPRFAELAPYYEERFGPWTRQIILLHIEKVKSSCGTAVPYYHYAGEREQLHEWSVQMNAAGHLNDYIAKHR